MYDTLSEIFVMNSFDLLMLGHHVLGGASHVACRIANSVCSYYHIYMYVAELSTPFCTPLGHVHARAHKEPRFQGSVYDIIDHLLLARILWGPYLQYSLYMSRDEWFTTEAGTSCSLQTSSLSFFSTLSTIFGRSSLQKGAQGCDPIR